MKLPLQKPLAFAFLFLTIPLPTFEEPKLQEANIQQFVPLQEVIPPEPPTLTVKAKVEPVEVADVLKKIAWCESQNRQFDSTGAVLRGHVNAQDVGYFQVNEKYHLADSIRLGMDIHTLEGNKAYGQHLFETQGTTPWNWSRHCWGDPNRVWSERGGELWSQ